MRHPDYLNIFFGGLIYSIIPCSARYAISGVHDFRSYALLICSGFIISNGLLVFFNWIDRRY